MRNSDADIAIDVLNKTHRPGTRGRERRAALWQ